MEFNFFTRKLLLEGDDGLGKTGKDIVRRERMSWQEYYANQSLLLASRSTCTRLSVGALIVRDNRVIASGYNGSVSGETHCIDEGCLIQEGHCVRTIHAEVNAVLQCAKYGIATQGSEVYVTHFPCLNCTKTLIQAGIKRINYIEDYRNNPYALELLAKSQVELHKVDIKTDRDD